MNAVNLPSISRALAALPVLALLAAPVGVALLLVPAQPALAQDQASAAEQAGGQPANPASDPTSGTPAAEPTAEITLPQEAQVYVPRRRNWSQGDRVTFAVLAAGIPGSGQLLQGRWIEGATHLGGAAVLGTLGFVGWTADNATFKWVSAIGLLGLSIYSPIDAYFAVPPVIPGPGARQ